MHAVAPNGLVLRILYAESLKCMFKALKRTHDFESVLESTHGLSKWLYRPTRSDANTGEFYLSINTYENTLTFLQKSESELDHFTYTNLNQKYLEALPPPPPPAKLL